MALKDSLRILIVDDMSVSRGLVTQALDQIGLKQYDWCKDGQSALTSVVNRPVHLVISDYEMPKMNGLDLLESLRQHKTTARIGFILLTGSADPAVISRGSKLGMNNYLKKPFSVPQLQKCIEAVVGRL
ncbi:response regulator [Parvularcula oceani]|uniref:response regulator n=1 Tax=Parvularcula oceani TaxID=1247963 RepID=UPI0004E192E2|nr:response regulator [Parvularcula oceani]